MKEGSGSHPFENVRIPWNMSETARLTAYTNLVGFKKEKLDESEINLKLNSVEMLSQYWYVLISWAKRRFIENRLKMLCIDFFFKF